MKLPIALAIISFMACSSALAEAGIFPETDAAFSANLENIRAQALSPWQAVQAFKAAQSNLSRDDVYHKVLNDLSGSEIPAIFIHDAIFDPKTQIIPEIVQSFGRPAEHLPYEEYRKIFITPENIELGAEFYREHQALLSQIEDTYNVDPLILVSLVGVETRYGAYAGKFPVISSLYTITAQLPDLSDWAAKELAEYLKLCYQNQFDPQSILGSYAGAFGYYQFMPSSYNAYAVDFDGNGTRSYDTWPDVLASVANYLAAPEHGYQAGDSFTPDSSIGKAIYSYNHSDDYVRVVLEFREAILAKLQEGK